MNLKKKKKGFTLIELMAVIAIIAILAAVLVPTVTGYINRAKKTAIITQVRNVVSAVETYNATASTTNIIKSTDTTSLSDIKNKVGGDFLDSKSIDKLPTDVPYNVLHDININTDSINAITVDQDGKLIKYDGQGTANDWPYTPPINSGSDPT